MSSQSRAFNKDTSAALGMCLDYVQRGYGIGGGASTGGSSAWDSWTRITKKKHLDRSFPKNVIIPIWFDGYWDGERYGHVAALNTATGEIYSSPWSKVSAAAGRHDVLPSIAEVERIYGMTYVGWSEDIAGQVVIKEQEENVAIIQNKENWYNRCNDTHIRITSETLKRNVFAAYVGNDFLKFVEDVTATKSAAVALKWQKVGKSASQEGWVKPSDADKKLAQIKKIIG